MIKTILKVTLNSFVTQRITSGVKYDVENLHFVSWKGHFIHWTAIAGFLNAPTAFENHLLVETYILFCSMRVENGAIGVNWVLKNIKCWSKMCEINQKNPAYGRQRISRRVRLGAPVGWIKNTRKPEFFEKRKNS